MAALGLSCCTWALSSCCEQGLLFVAVHGLLIAVACYSTWALGAWASVVVAVVAAHGLSCSVACGILSDQGSNGDPCIGKRILNHCTTREALEGILQVENDHFATIILKVNLDNNYRQMLNLRGGGVR